MHIQLINTHDERYSQVIEEESYTAANRILQKSRGLRIDQAFISGIIRLPEHELNELYHIMYIISQLFSLKDEGAGRIAMPFISVTSASNPHRNSKHVSYFVAFNTTMDARNMFDMLRDKTYQLLK